MLGGVGSQGILLISYFFIVQYYDSRQFGEFSIFLSGSLILSSFFFFKYDLKSHTLLTVITVKRVLGRAFITSFLLLIGLILTAFYLSFFFYFISEYLLIICLTFLMGFFMSLLNVLISLFLRQNRLIFLNILRVTVSLLIVLFQLHFFKNIELGLIYSYIVANCCYLVVFIKLIPFELRLIKSCKYIFRNLRVLKFPIMATFVNSLSLQLMPLLIGAFKSVSIVGLFSIGQKVTSAPVTLLCMPLSQVFITESSKLVRNNTSIKLIFFKVCLLSIFFFSLPLLVISVYIQDIAGLFFPENWESAIIYMPYLFYVASIQAIVNPIASYPIVVGKEHLMFTFDSIRLFIVFSCTVLGFIYSPDCWILVYTIASIASYLLYIIFYGYDILKRERS